MARSFPFPSVSTCAGVSCSYWLFWRSSSGMFPWSYEDSSPWCFGWQKIKSHARSSWFVELATYFLWEWFAPRWCVSSRLSVWPSCLLWVVSPQHYPAFLYFCCAGIAAAAGELAKDQRHQDAVEEAGRVWLYPFGGGNLWCVVAFCLEYAKNNCWLHHSPKWGFYQTSKDTAAFYTFVDQ